MSADNPVTVKKVLGYVVVIDEDGKPNLTWDGDIHPTVEAAQESITDVSAGYWEETITEWNPRIAILIEEEL